VIYILINRLTTHVKIKMTICAHGSLDGLSLVHAKLLDVFRSGDPCAMPGLYLTLIVFGLWCRCRIFVFDLSYGRNILLLVLCCLVALPFFYWESS
jgi:hypothetical protein